MNYLIEANHVCKKYSNGGNEISAVYNVTLAIEAGTSVAITGPSGCGKTTLLNLIGLIKNQTEGEIIINGVNTNELSKDQKSVMRNEFFGYIVQDYAVLEEQTIQENIEIPLYYRRKKLSKKGRKEKVLEILEKVGLEKKLKEKVVNLSGGQKQRVAIARALINNPKVILADEPTGALDTKNSNDIFELLLRFVAEGTTLLMVTHNDELAAKCDQRIKMLDGRIERKK